MAGSTNICLFFFFFFFQNLGMHHMNSLAQEKNKGNYSAPKFTLSKEDFTCLTLPMRNEQNTSVKAVLMYHQSA